MTEAVPPQDRTKSTPIIDAAIRAGCAGYFPVPCPQADVPGACPSWISERFAKRAAEMERQCKQLSDFLRVATISRDEAFDCLPQQVRVGGLIRREPEKKPFPSRGLSDKPWTISALVP